MRTLRPLILSTFLCSLACPLYAQAQSSSEIFIPVNPTEQTQETQNTSPLSRLIALQSELYEIVLSYDPTAKQVEKFLPAFEEGWLQIQQNHAMNPSSDVPLITQAYNLPNASLLLKEPTLCARIDADLKDFVRSHAQEVQHLVKQISADTSKLSDEQKNSLAQSIHTAKAASKTDYRRAQEILYLCLYKYKNDIGASRSYSVEKTLREWFNLQAPLIDLWIGPVD